MSGSLTADFLLDLDVVETGEFGNKYNGAVDADGIISACFTGTTERLYLTFTGYDVDSDSEIEVFVNGVSLGFLDEGLDNDGAFYSFSISAARQIPGDNEITFVQSKNVNFVWGVTDVMISAQPPADVVLTPEVSNPIKLGHNFDGVTNDDRDVIARFTGTGVDLNLQFSAYDVDSDNEIEVFLNGNSLGFLQPGANNGLASYELEILAADQLVGDNDIVFVQQRKVTHTWGVTDLLLTTSSVSDTVDIDLALNVPNTGEFGNKYNGATDDDGTITAGFTGTADIVYLQFAAYDVDSGNEIEVLLNGESLGFLAEGVDNGLAVYEFEIAPEDQLPGQNVISFVQSKNIAFKWGVTDIVVTDTPFDPPSFHLTLGATEAGEFGNKFNGTTNDDGTIEATFDGTNVDLKLQFSGYDIDSGAELEVLLNGESLGFVETGVNNDLQAYEIDIPAGVQLAGENILTFVQAKNPNFVWGITDILLTDNGLPVASDFVLIPEVAETAPYGNNFNGTADLDGVVTAEFTGTGGDLFLQLKGFDIDSDGEVEVFLNGVSIGGLAEGLNNATSQYEFEIGAADQLAGQNFISFVKSGNPLNKWGVTDVVLSATALGTAPDFVLAPNVVETGEFGNDFNGQVDDDGVIRGSFQGTGVDAFLQFQGYDFDVQDEVEVFLNGVSLGFIEEGFKDTITNYEIEIAAGDQLAGDNEIMFVQSKDINFGWGVTNIVLSDTPKDTSNDIALTLNVLDQNPYGHNYEGIADDDGVIAATFTGTGTDLFLEFAGYDIDFGNEMEVLVNGVSFGFVAEGQPDGLTDYFIRIDAADQVVGENVVEFVQSRDVSFRWGVSELLLEEVEANNFVLVNDVLETGSFGNKFDDDNDPDGRIITQFEGGVSDLHLAFDGFDIDFDDEMEVFLNGVSQGFVLAGVNNDLASYELDIALGDQIVGTNQLEFVQANNTTFKWGVTNLLLTGSPTIDIGSSALDSSLDIAGPGLTDVGLIFFRDSDLADTHSASVTSVTFNGDASGLNALFAMGFLGLSVVDASGSTAGAVTWNFSAPDALFGHLAENEELEIVYEIEVADNDGNAGSESLTVTIIGENDAPVGADDAGSTTEDAAASFTVTLGDFDIEDDDIEILNVNAAGALGAVSINPDGDRIDYDPNGQFEGLDAGETATETFSYTLTDGMGATDTATVVVTVNGLNDAPEATSDSTAVPESSMVFHNLIGDDLDAEGHALTLTAIDDSPASGSAVIAPDGDSVLYNPNGAFDYLAAGESATDSFTYTVSDGEGGVDTGQVTVRINGENDTPSLGGGDSEASASLVDAGVLGNGGFNAGFDGGLTLNSGTEGDWTVGGVEEWVASGNAGLLSPSAAALPQLPGVGLGNKVAFIDNGASLTNVIGTLQEDTSYIVDFDVYTRVDALNTPAPWLVQLHIDGTHIGLSSSSTSPAAGSSSHVQINFGPTSFDLSSFTPGVSEMSLVFINNGGSSSQQLIIDNVEVQGAGDVLSEAGHFDFSDVDASDTHSASVTGVALSGATSALGSADAMDFFSLAPVDQVNDEVDWSFSMHSGLVNGLSAGQSLTMDYGIELSDGNGGLVNDVVSITIEGEVLI